VRAGRRGEEPAADDEERSSAEDRDVTRTSPHGEVQLSIRSRS